MRLRIALILVLFAAGCHRAPATRMQGQFVNFDTKAQLMITPTTITAIKGDGHITLGYTVANVTGDDVTIDVMSMSGSKGQLVISVSDKSVDIKPQQVWGGHWVRQ